MGSIDWGLLGDTHAVRAGSRRWTQNLRQDGEVEEMASSRRGRGARRRGPAREGGQRRAQQVRAEAVVPLPSERREGRDPCGSREFDLAVYDVIGAYRGAASCAA